MLTFDIRLPPLGRFHEYTFPDKDSLTSAAFGTMVLILASFRGLRSVHFVSDYATP